MILGAIVGAVVGLILNHAWDNVTTDPMGREMKLGDTLLDMACFAGLGMLIVAVL